MLKNTAVERYAQALFQLAIEEKKLEQFSKELQDIFKLLTNYPELEKILYHPRISEQEKKNLVKKILGSEVSPLVLNFLMLIIDKGREIYLKDIIKYFDNLAKKAKGILEIQVDTALELTSEIEAKLVAKLEKITGKKIELKIKVDPSLLGGIRLRIGDKIIDGSIQRHLERIKENLASVQVSQLEVS